MGAFELTDLIGHDVNYAVTCSVFEAFYGDFRFQPSLVQKELVDAGRLGRKSGQGFYRYSDDAERPAVAEMHSQTHAGACVIEGHLGVMQPLMQRLKDSGVTITERAGSGLIRVGDATLALSDGRLASQRAVEDGLRNLVLLDLALDYQSASRIAISWSADTAPDARDQAVALLQQAGLRVTAVADLPGLVVLRTVVMLANEAADAVLQGVASAADIDLAMCAGVNYPRGPLVWAEQIGIGHSLRVLDHLQRSYGESRYRPSLLLRRLHAEGAATVTESAKP